MSDDPKDRRADVYVPLACCSCHQSAYDVNIEWLGRSESIEPEMLRKSDPKAPDPAFGRIMDCPYCGGPLGKSEIYPVLGGGFTVKFVFLGEVGRTA